MNNYFEGTMSGRRIFWCPGGEGHLAYCPQPIDPDHYTYCCLFYYKGTDMPSCCRFPFHTGVLISFFLGGIILAFLLIFLTCWFLPICPLAKRMMDTEEEEVIMLSPYEQSNDSGQA